MDYHWDMDMNHGWKNPVTNQLLLIGGVYLVMICYQREKQDNYSLVFAMFFTLNWPWDWFYLQGDNMAIMAEWIVIQHDVIHNDYSRDFNVIYNDKVW